MKNEIEFGCNSCCYNIDEYGQEKNDELKKQVVTNTENIEKNRQAIIENGSAIRAISDNLIDIEETNKQQQQDIETFARSVVNLQNQRDDNVDRFENIEKYVNDKAENVENRLTTIEQNNSTFLSLHNGEYLSTSNEKQVYKGFNLLNVYFTIAQEGFNHSVDFLLFYNPNIGKYPLILNTPNIETERGIYQVTLRDFIIDEYPKPASELEMSAIKYENDAFNGDFKQTEAFGASSIKVKDYSIMPLISEYNRDTFGPTMYQPE